MHRIRSIVKPEALYELGARRIGGPNLAPAMKESIGLVEIDGVSNIDGDYRIVLPRLCNTVHLDRQQNRDPVRLQLPRQGDRFRPAPAMSINDDAGILLFLDRKCPVAVGVQEPPDFLVGALAAVIFKNLHIHTRRVFFSDACSELDRAMDEVIMPDESTDKTDDDGRRAWLRAGRGRSCRGCRRGDQTRSGLLTRGHGHREQKREADADTHDSEVGRIV